MLNLFFGFSGRLRRREFLMWSIVVPLALVVPPAIALASSMTSKNTSLAEDLHTSGMLWPFVILILLANYVSVALFWKRIQDADETKTGKFHSAMLRWGYAILTALNSLVVGLNLVALGQIEGSAAGLAILGLWGMACFLKPQSGPNRFGPDPRDGAAIARAQGEEPMAGNSNLDAAMERALAERSAQATAAAAPKLARAVNPLASPSNARPSFGKRT